ncbi:hypothetical protein A6A08_11105 [Nocardiopsis sp. TSRI0078]|uniref:CU044_5270 family protein n=1 Tax=unclassified Nocardiopsis TaxID=2649073 RepID=UPI00093DC595|nr:CU044_5270 family protein [Nocardiopsis sp. TSRI0078]OKI15071.1 hypothetical protein A6A08_11105 [Nocardiopsis sp. TSRI0078]
MNELDHLRRMRADVPEPGPEELAMRTGWRPDGERPVSRARPVSLLPLALSGAAVLAAAAVFAFLVLGPVDVTEPDTVSVGPAPESSDGSGSTDDVMEVMEPVIEAARSQNVDGGTWYTHLVQGDARGVGDAEDRYGIYGLRTWETWTVMEEGTITSRAVSTDWSLLREDDRDSWERDGSPTRWPYDPDTGEEAVPEDMSDLGSPYEDQPAEYAFGTRVLTLGQVQALPSDPEELAELLLDQESPDGPRNEAMLLRPVLEYPLPPEVRAGVYTLLTRAAGVRTVEGVTDVSGRPAVGVAYDVDASPLGGYEQRILFDPQTGMLLSTELVVVEPAEANADWNRPGDVVRYDLYESMGWTDERPQ